MFKRVEVVSGPGFQTNACVYMHMGVHTLVCVSMYVCKYTGYLGDNLGGSDGKESVQKQETQV